VKVNDL